jgi:hypothetical protein
LPTRPPAGHILAQGRRGAQEEGEAHQGGHRLHTAPNFLPEQGREAGRTRRGGEESELMHMIEKIYYIKKTSALIPRMRLCRKHLMYSTR